MPIPTPPPSSPLSPKVKNQDSNRRVTIVDPKIFPPNQPKKLNEPLDISRELELLPNLQSAMKNSKFKYTNNNRLSSPLPLPQHPSPKSNNILQSNKFQQQQLQQQQSNNNGGGRGILSKLSHIINYLLPFKLNFTKLFQTTLKGIILITLISLIYMYCWFIYYFIIRGWLAGNGTANGLKFIDDVFFQFEEGKLPLVNINFKEFTQYHKFSNNLIYNIKLNLKVPESINNLSLGNFMINLNGYNEEKELIYKVSKPLLMKFRSQLFQIIRTVVLSPFMILGYCEEYQTLSLDLSPPSNITNINELSNLILNISTPDIQLDSASLVLITQLTGIAYYVVNWPLTTGIMATNTLFGGHLILLFLAYHFFKGLLSSSKSAKLEANNMQQVNGQQSTATASTQSNLKPHLDLGLEEEFDELEGKEDILKELEAFMDKVKVPSYEDEVEDNLSTSESATFVDLEGGGGNNRVAKDLKDGLPTQRSRDSNDDDNDEDGGDSETQVGGSQTINGDNSNNRGDEKEFDQAWDASKSGIRKRETDSATKD